MTEKETPEERNEDLAENLTNSTPAEEAIYYAPARNYQIANFRPEKKGMMGDIQQFEQPLRFTDNILVTNDPKIIAFVEQSDSFKNGVVRKCKTMAEAQELIAGQMAIKGIKSVKCETIESTQYQPKGEGVELVKKEEVVNTQ